MPRLPQGLSHSDRKSPASITNAVVVFARLPVIGKVKTRLFGDLTPAQACALHQACLADAVAMVDEVPRCRRFLYVAGGRAQARALGRTLGLSSKWRVETQRGANLGARMRNAFADCFRAGCAKVILTGTDTPWMGKRRLELALHALDRVDVVLGPARDGGYYLVGTRRGWRNEVPELFAGIGWGTRHVRRQTVAKLRRARISFRLLARDFDLDRSEDVARAHTLLRRNPRRAKALAGWIKDWRNTTS